MKTPNPKCKNCGERFTPIRSTLQKYCLKPDCISVMIEVEKEKQRKKENKDWQQRKAAMKVTAYVKENKQLLQQEINKLARMIDNRFKYDCIDCKRPFGKQQDGGHFHSVGAHPALRYNLHNIHSQRSECNCNGLGGGRMLEYYEGLVERYGLDYAIKIRYQNVIDFKILKLTEHEIVEKLAIVRKLIRYFETFSFPDSRAAREVLNNLIGIYK